MNLLAHAYLSFDNKQITAGNMISDYIKGKKQFDYPAEIQKGIRLHRMIDEFTDAHEVTAEAKKYLKPTAGLYSGAFVDIVYDHFLANNKIYWQQVTLQHFVQNTYAVLTEQAALLPEKFNQTMPYMLRDNWLYNYQFTWGIEKSFNGIVYRAKFINDATPVFEAFIENYDALKNLSAQFLPQVKNYAFTQLNNLLKS